MKSSEIPNKYEELQCTFISRIYRSDDEAFCICTYQMQDGDLFTAVGKELPEFDYPVTLSGEWKTHPSFGEQFQVDMIVDILPRRQSDIAAFLSSISAQVSEQQALALSKAYPAANLWDILYNSPEKLYPIADIGERRILMLQREVKRLSTRRDLANLFGDDLPMTKRQYRKICDIFSDDPSEILDAVKANPFLLIHAGYNFQELDAFAAKHTEYPADDYRRILAAAQDALLTAQRESHVGLPDDILIRKIAKALQPLGGIPDVCIQNFLHHACTKKDLIFMGHMFYLGRAYQEEDIIAERLSDMAALPAKTIDRKKFLRCMKKYGEKKGFSLSENQQDAVWTVLTRPVCVITGGPGTGKSTILDAVLYCWKKFYSDKDWCLMAPTGKASVRMQETTGECAATIHSTLDLTITSDFETPEYSDISLRNGVIVIDESSMIDLSVAAALIEAIASAKGEQHLVIVGDPDQLPSVGYGNFLDDLIESKVIPVASLNTIYRQAEGNPIITNSIKMRNDDADLDWSNPMFNRYHTGTDADNMEAACKLYLRLVKKVGIENVALLSPYREKTDIATNILNKKLQDVLNPKNGRKAIRRGKSMEFRVGDRVMQLRNTEYLSNGDVGTVTSIDPSADDDEACLTVEFESGIAQGYSWEEIYSLDLAYAFTVHKSQGSQYKCVLIVLPNKASQFLTRSILYTAVTRAKEYVSIFSPTPTIQYMIHNARKNVRYTQLIPRLRFLFERKIRANKKTETKCAG